MNTGLMYCLYNRVMSSLHWLNLVLWSARRTLRGFFALVFMSSVYGENLIFFVICHSECGGGVSVGYGYVVECYCGLWVVFVSVGYD